MVKTQNEPTVGHLGSTKNVQDPLQQALDHFTVYPPTGHAEGGGLAASSK